VEAVGVERPCVSVACRPACPITRTRQAWLVAQVLRPSSYLEQACVVDRARVAPDGSPAARPASWRRSRRPGSRCTARRAAIASFALISGTGMHNWLCCARVTPDGGPAARQRARGGAGGRAAGVPRDVRHRAPGRPAPQRAGHRAQEPGQHQRAALGRRAAHAPARALGGARARPCSSANFATRDPRTTARSLVLGAWQTDSTSLGWTVCFGHQVSANPQIYYSRW